MDPNQKSATVVPSRNPREAINDGSSTGVPPRAAYRRSQNQKATAAPNAPIRKAAATVPLVRVTMGHNRSPVVVASRHSPTGSIDAPDRMVRSRRRKRNARISVIRANGTLRTRSNRHPKSASEYFSRTPPRIGPETPARPPAVLYAPNAFARAFPDTRSVMMPSTCELMVPAPTPCPSRANTIIDGSDAHAPRIPITAKMLRPAKNKRRRPTTSPSRPAGTRAKPKVSE